MYPYGEQGGCVPSLMIVLLTPVNKKMHERANAAHGKVWVKLVLQKGLEGKAN